jgi:hypothetical protein
MTTAMFGRILMQLYYAVGGVLRYTERAVQHLGI